MHTIKKLDKHLMNMIAAGEVVERPAGIVKELVENAIDAHANIIEISIHAGGIDFISVSDNGIGMSKEDALLSFERHATSKISSEKDLWSIGTLGFRGEALPSIASVARVTMITNNGTSAHKLSVKYGEKVQPENVAANVGTQIIVEGLFHNTPARLKSFNSINYEKAVVISTIEKFAFSYPNISFILTDEEKTLLHTSGNDDLLEIMYHVYGKEVARNSFTFNDETSDFKISGVLALPSETRANRNHIQIFINDRMIRSYKITNDVIAAYRNLMFKDRFPIAIIKLEMDYKLVDVNVHPSKWEVRIAKEQVLSEFIQSSIRNAVHKNLEAVSVKRVKLSEPVYEQVSLDTDTVYVSDNTSNNNLNIKEEVKVESNQIQANIVINEIENIQISTELLNESTVEAQVKEETTEEVKYNSELKTNEFSALIVIGQLHGKYILAQSPESLYIIDQHAAEERSNFEKILKQFVENKIESSPILIPIIVDVKASEVHLIDKLIEALLTVGFSIEYFSESSVVVREIPLWLMNGNTEQFVLDMLEYLSTHKNVDIETIRYDVIATKACKASIKFNHHLSVEEMNQVIYNLSQCEEPYHCPHGRPTLIKMSEAMLIKEFMR